MRRFRAYVAGAGLCAWTLMVLGPVSSFAEYSVVDVGDGGTVSGQVLWKDEVPQLPPLRVFADQDECGTEVASPALQIDPATKGLKQVLVYIEQVERGKAPSETYRIAIGKRPADPASFRCQFQQQLYPFVRTADVSWVNYESVLHNPHLFTPKHAGLFNIAMPTAGREIETKILRARGVGLPLQCDVHVHMNAWAAAMDHPYFAVTDAQGRFEIAGLPPGRYQLVAWHPGFNIVRFVASRPVYDEPHILRQTIEIEPKGRTEQRFEFPARPVEVDWKVAGDEGLRAPE